MADFNLDGYRSKLDETGLQVANNQSASLEHKRALAEKTKEFKRTASPEVFKAVSSLIRAYQEEIDSLSTRAKFGEAAFLDVYQRLYEAPDPHPALTSALDMASQASEVEAQLLRITSELAEYKSESASLQNQAHTVRTLQDKVKTLENSLQEQDRALQHAAESAAASEAARALEEAAEREARLSQRLEETVNSLSAVKELHEAGQNQLFSMQEMHGNGSQAAAEQQQAALQHELDLANQEADATQDRLRSLEQELANYRNTGNAQPARADLLARDTTLLQQLAASRDEVTQLQEHVDTLTAQLQSTQEQSDARCAELQAALDDERARAAAQAAEAAPVQQSEGRVAELQAQVQMLQAVAGYAVDQQGETEEEGGGTLEAMLLEKNRHLEHELTMARVAATDATTALEGMRARMTDMETSLEHHKRLVARLEEDLLVAGGADADVAEHAQEDGQHAMVKVLSSQRDRLRTRCQQLEEEAHALGSALAKAKKDIEASKADNVALVERLRYVQGYKGGRSREDVEVGDVEGRYAGLYESKVDPFSKFRDREREQRRRHMGMADRAMFLFGQLINSSKLARTLVFVYTLVLHALVFFMMMHATHKTPTQSLASCGDLCARLQQQQAQVAGTTGNATRGL